MTEKLIALVLLLFGGGVTLFILFKTGLAILVPVAQKKIEQKMQADKASQLQNELHVHQQINQQQMKNKKKKMKSS